ncbi:MAG: DMT family transporter [Alphaproteobacteria bacterium]
MNVLFSTKFLFLIGLGFVWSLRVASVKHAVENGVPPQVIIEFAMFGIAAVMLGILFLSKQKLPLTKQAIAFYFIGGSLGMALPFFVEAVVSPHLTVFVLIVIVMTMPIMTMTLLSLTGVEKLQGVQILAILIGFAAAMMIIFDGNNLIELSQGNLFWVLVAFGVPLLYAINTTYVAGKWPSYINPLQVAAGQALFISIAVLLASPFSGLWQDIGQISQQPLSFLGVLVAECTGLFFYFALIRSQGAAYMIMANYVAIAFGVFWGAFLFNETIGIISIIAAPVLGLGIYLAQTKREN